MPDLDPLADSAKRRKILSFVRRQGRATAAQLRALSEHWGQYGINYENKRVENLQLFGTADYPILEIGFGDGQALLELAQHNPLQNYLGIEVHRPGVGRLLSGLAKAKLNNVRLWQHDAIEVLHHCIADSSLAAIFLFFPDPWPKKRHHKRRIVQAEFAQLIRTKLIDGGLVHMATDWQPYAIWMLEVLQATKGLCNCADHGPFVVRPPARPVTKFEQRGQKLGHSVWDLLFKRA